MKAAKERDFEFAVANLLRRREWGGRRQKMRRKRTKKEKE